MQHRFETFIGPRDCEFELDGANIACLRRVKLKAFAETIDVPGDGPKNEVLKRVIVGLRAIGAPKNLDELAR